MMTTLQKKLMFLLTTPLLSTILCCSCASTKSGETPHKRDTEIERNFSLASTAYSSGDPHKASLYYFKALERARFINDPQAIGNAAYNYAACLIQAGDISNALTFLQESEAEYKTAGAAPYEIIFLHAKVLEELGDYDAALSKLASINLPGAERSKQCTADIITARLLHKKGEDDKAYHQISEIVKHRKEFEQLSPFMQAEAMRIMGGILLKRQNEKEGLKAMEKAIALYKNSGAFSDMAKALKEKGDALLASDKISAIDCYIQAARTFYYSNQPDKAKEVLSQIDLALKGLKDIPPELAVRIDVIKKLVSSLAKP